MKQKRGVAHTFGCAVVGLALCGTTLAQTHSQARSVLPQPKSSSPNTPPKGTATVEFHNGLLHIVAADADLNTVLQKTSALTGMKLQGTTNGDRLYGDYGPAAPADVLNRILNGLPYNYVLLESPRTAAPEQLVISARSGGQPAAPTPPPAATGAPQAEPAESNMQDQNIPPPEEVPAADQPVDQTVPSQDEPPQDLNGANAQPDNNNANPGAKTPAQFLEELKRLHQADKPPQ